MIGTILFMILLVPIGAGLFWAWWTEATLLDRRISALGGIFGAVGCLIGALGAPIMILGLFRRSRLILGRECFQLVNGERSVRFQVPYANIARMEFVQESDTKYIGIDLRDVRDPNTLVDSPESVKKLSGWHFKLADTHWAEPLAKICDRIEEHLQSSPP
jgi:hypothetical protein